MSNSVLEDEPRPSSESPVLTEVSIADHIELVRPHHRFRGVSHGGDPWDLSHLDPFAFRVDPGLGFEVTVVVLFSSHCFTKSLARDGRPRRLIPLAELFDDGREVRVLCERRYEHSRRHLPVLVRDLHRRTIQFARDNPPNFVTSTSVDGQNPSGHQYVVFFEISRDNKRKGRLLLQVQSAYAVELSEQQRFRLRRRIAFLNLLKATSLRRKVSG
ncbi:hypothetical protein [Mitsuaria sp. GD03876]|uniref:hypothetical protein n=1 Tax=Mitsuaria sp. GD03876 TaxID=2975399 RepID=UPI00244D420F|nr:hypothetical protein [Mitsuaria sp. GD03876]MDH0864425.1 hypothetical protein [Mitsuaria sp. GD03876]